MSILLSYAIASEIHIRKSYEKLKNYSTTLINTYAPQAKSYGVAAVYRVRRAVVLLAEWVDVWLPVENPPCDKSILCLHEGRHKKGCFAYTVSAKQYTKGIQNA